MREHVLVPYPDTLEREPTATHCRSTLLVTSIQALKRHGHYDRYVRAISPRHLQEIVSSSGAGVWIPIDVGVAHYAACDTLDLPPDEILALGGEVVHALQRTVIGSVLKSTTSGIGISPLAGIEKFASVRARSIKGGGVRVIRFGPKDVRVDFVGEPFAAIRYFRVGYRGFLQAGCEFFSRRVIVAELEAFRSPTTLGYRIAWV
jgi:hypothetical protein